MGYRMVTRNDVENEGEKCPNCKFLGRTFLDISGVTWACMDCGCAFVPKRKRLEVRQEIAGRKTVILDEKISEKPKMEKVDIVNENGMPPRVGDNLKCDYPGCDFVAKLPVALAGHKRKHARSSVES